MISDSDTKISLSHGMICLVNQLAGVIMYMQD